ncbi:MAG: purine-nucleoside phosphorylase [Clostridioides sp.]|nr:purine-nucleoside phosphorylase [Clostridioides sp.]
MFDNIMQSVVYIKNRINILPEIGIILGSGLGGLVSEMEDIVYLEYAQIPNFPVSTVMGHEGRLIFGTLCGKKVVAMQGRFHYYEGYSQRDVTMPVRVMKYLGVKTLIVTNAAGAVNTEFNPGDLMIISDHINFSGNNPLIGHNDDKFGARFPDMSDAYSKRYREVVRKSASKLGIDIKEGVYMFFSGPTYETPAEVRMARVLGADAVGMSTVPEVIVAAQSGVDVIGISCITNMGTGILDKPLSHEEVIETTERVQNDFSRLVKDIISSI